MHEPCPPSRPRSRRSPRPPSAPAPWSAPDRAVVGQHPHAGVADPLGDRRDAQVEVVSVRQLDRPEDGPLEDPRSRSGSGSVVLMSFSCSLRCALGRAPLGWRRPAKGVDLVRDVLCVVLDPAEQRGASGVLPGQAEEIEPRRLRHAAPMHDATVPVEDRGINPRVVGPEARGPDDATDLELRAVAEAQR